jgi:5-methylcytosine-specific restriction endonuclease McrA
MAVDWNTLFDNWGIKTVTRTDKTKCAYVPNDGQRKAIEAAGFSPAADSSEPGKIINLTVWADPGVDSVAASYYLAKRSEQANRNPEPRMGRQLISEWLQPGDNLVIGNIGSSVYVLKAGGLDDDLAVAEGLVRSLPASVVHACATVAAGPASRRSTSRMEFVRNPYVVAAALLRADNRCEVPACTRELFLRDDGTPYLEVHHLVPLSKGGADALFNVAALCPSCHREMHHGIRGEQQAAAVLAHIEAMNTGGQP